MIKGKEDITDKEFEEILLPFYDNYSEYLINYVIPDTIAFYLANGYRETVYLIVNYIIILILQLIYLM